MENTTMADPVNLSNKEKAEKLDNFLRTRKAHSPRRREVTVSKVKEEAALILEEFLKKQLRRKSLTNEAIVGTLYQRVTDIDIVEKETTSDDRTSSYFEHQSLEDDIPYADEDDVGIRAGSEPPNIQYCVTDDNDLLHSEKVNNYRPVKSKSLSPCPSHPREFHLNLKREVGMSHPLPEHPSFLRNEEILRGMSSMYPPPPPPPSTPYNGSEQSSKRSSPVLKIHQISDSTTPSPVTGISNKSTPSPVTGSSDNCTSSPVKGTFDNSTSSPVKGTFDKSTTSPVSVSEYDQGTAKSFDSKKSSSLPKSEMGSSVTTASISSPSKTDMKISPIKSRHRSGSISSADTDAEEIDERKKKSMFKRAQERLSRALTIQKRKKDSKDEKHKKTKKEKKMKKRKHKSNVESNDDLEFDGLDVIMDKRTHKTTYIQQTHNNSDAEHPMILRTEDTVMVTDVTENSNKQKHIETHKKVKESRDEAVENGGLFGTLRKITSWGSIRKKISGSKSSEFRKDSQKSAKKYDRTSSTIEKKHHENVDEDVYRETTKSPGYTHSHTTRVVTSLDNKRIPIDSADNCPGNSFDLPKDKSFVLNIESDTHQKFEKRKKDGKIIVVTDVNRHEHLDLSADRDLEVDDSSDEGKAKDIPFDKKSKEEKDAIYEKIADRLAVIGDNFMAECQTGHSHTDSSRGVSSTSSPHTKSEVESSTSETTPDVIEKTHLTSQQMELTLYIREKAADIDKRLASEARNAALRILHQGVTYSNFQREVTQAVGNEVGWNQLSALFHITKRAVTLAGAGGALALQIKEMSLQYVADRFASWIVGQGGWDSMLSEEDWDPDLD